MTAFYPPKCLVKQASKINWDSGVYGEKWIIPIISILKYNAWNEANLKLADLIWLIADSGWH